MGLAELSREVQLNKTTVYRLVSVLLRHRFLRQDPETGRYRLGLALAELGQLCLAGMEVRREAAPYLNQLMNTVRETVHLGVLDEGEVVYIDKFEYQGTIRLSSRIGSRVPVHSSALGKAILACSSEQQVNLVIARGLAPRTPNTITEPSRFRDELLATRLRGYAVDNEENRESIRCIAAPILDHMGEPIAAISVTGLAANIAGERIAEIGRLVKDAAEQVSRRVGYRGKAICH